jgi:hypothetical protein
MTRRREESQEDHDRRQARINAVFIGAVLLVCLIVILALVFG